LLSYAVVWRTSRSASQQQKNNRRSRLLS